MLRDFGIVTVVDLTVALAGVMLVLPAALVWAEQRLPSAAVAASRARLEALRSRRRRARLSMAGQGDRDPGGWWPEGEGNGPATSADRDEPKRRLPRGLASPDRPRPSGRYSMFVGLAFVALIVVALLNLLERRRTPASSSSAACRWPGSRCPTPSPRRRSMPTRTSPRTTARARATRARRTTGGRLPARSTAPGAIRVCDLFDKPARDLVLVHPRRRLRPQPGRLRRGRRPIPRPGQLPQHRRPRRSRGRSPRIVREHGWTVPVGLDRDGAVSNLYRVGVCPTIVLAYPGRDRLRHGDPRRQLRRRRDLSGLVDELLAAPRAARATGPLMGRTRRIRHSRARGAVDAALREEYPGPLHPLARGRPRLGASAAGAEEPARRALRPLRRARRRSTFRTKPIPSAYRVFYRHIGLDPDEQPTPPEAVVLERMLKGGFVSRNLLDDALTIAMIESGVAGDRRSTPTRSRARSGSARANRVRRSRAGRRAAGRDARDRRRGAPAGAAVRRDRPPGAASARRRGAPRSWWSASPGSRDRRRGGALARRGDHRGGLTAGRRVPARRARGYNGANAIRKGARVTELLEHDPKSQGDPAAAAAPLRAHARVAATDIGAARAVAATPDRADGARALRAVREHASRGTRHRVGGRGRRRPEDPRHRRAGADPRRPRRPAGGGTGRDRPPRRRPRRRTGRWSSG